MGEAAANLLDMAKQQHTAVTVVVAALLILAVLPQGEAVYTKVKQGQQKCFIELLHANKVVVVKYESPDQAALPQDPEYQKGHVGILFQVFPRKSL